MLSDRACPLYTRLRVDRSRPDYRQKPLIEVTTDFGPMRDELTAYPEYFWTSPNTILYFKYTVIPLSSRGAKLIANTATERTAV